jgi:hypothetical protein
VRSYVKQNLSLAPNNASAWNYLRGVLEHARLPFATVMDFVRPYTVPLPATPTDIADLENPPPGRGAELPCAAAIEFLADVYEEAGGADTDKAVEVPSSALFFCYVLTRLCSCGSHSRTNTIRFARSLSLLRSLLARP